MDTSRSFLLRNARQPKINIFTSVILLGGVIIAFLFAYSAFGDDTFQDEPTELKYAGVIFRHGDKTPTSFYANDPYKENVFWPEGWGQLTIKGKKQMFKLGELMRSRYGQWLGPYSKQTVRVDSSDHDRCLQSAGALLASLLPPTDNQIWNNQLLWQPIPVHATPLALDKLITVSASCPRYVEEKKRADEDLARKYDTQNYNLYKYLTEKTGQNISTLLEVETLFNTLEIERDSGMTLPEWTTTVFPDRMKDIAALVLASFTYTPVMKRLKGGPLVGAIVSNMNAYMNGSSTRKLSLFAAHDLTIVNVWRTLGFDDVTFKPELGSALLLELHVINNIPQVELYYISSYAATEPVKRPVPNCDEPCSLDRFNQLMSPVIPIHWDTDCTTTSN